MTVLLSINSLQACWKEPLVYVLFFMPVRSWDEILSIHHQAYYYFKYLHLPGEGTRRLPTGEINGVSLLAATPSLGRNKERHRSSCSVCGRKCVQIWGSRAQISEALCVYSALHKSGVLLLLFGPTEEALNTKKGEGTRMLIKCTF